jgi:hypothetical protein
MLQSRILERMHASAWKIYDIKLLLPNHVENPSPEPSNQRQRKFLGTQKQEVDVTTPCPIYKTRDPKR